MKCSTYANLINGSSAVAHFGPRRLFIECGAIRGNGWGASCPRLARRMSCWNPSEPAAARGLPPLTALTAAGEHNWTPAWQAALGSFGVFFFVISQRKWKSGDVYWGKKAETQLSRPKLVKICAWSGFFGFFFFGESLPVQMAWVYFGWDGGPPPATVTLSEKLEKKKSETQGAVDD